MDSFCNNKIKIKANKRIKKASYQYLCCYSLNGNVSMVLLLIAFDLIVSWNNNIIICAVEMPSFVEYQRSHK